MSIAPPPPPLEGGSSNSKSLSLRSRQQGFDSGLVRRDASQLSDVADQEQFMAQLALKTAPTQGRQVSIQPPVPSTRQRGTQL